MLGAICQLSWHVNKLTMSSRRFLSFQFCLPFYPPIPSASIFFQMIKLPMFKTSGKSHLMALIHGYLMAVFIDDGPYPMKFFLSLVAHNLCVHPIISFVAKPYTIYL